MDIFQDSLGKALLVSDVYVKKNIFITTIFHLSLPILVLVIDWPSILGESLILNVGTFLGLTGLLVYSQPRFLRDHIQFTIRFITKI